MCSKRFIGFLVAPVATALSLIGPAPKAEGATDFTSTFTMSFDGIAGFSGAFYGGEDTAEGQSGVTFQLTSNVHRISQVNLSISTSQEDPSEATIFMYASGIKNTTVNHDDYAFGMGFNVGGVNLYQSTSMNSWHDASNVAFNSVYASMQISPLDLRNGQLFYQEYVTPDTSYTVFMVTAYAYGSFPNDAMGLPFVGVPTSGTTATLGLAGLVALRRRRVN